MSGCATFNGSKIALDNSVFDDPSVQSEIVVLHEIGHTKGLDHEEINSYNLMYEDTSRSTVGIRKDQCPNFSVGKQYYARSMRGLLMNKSLISGVVLTLLASPACANMIEVKQVESKCVEKEAQVTLPREGSSGASISRISKITTGTQSSASRDKAIAGMDRKRENLTELERLAVPTSSIEPPSREQVVPYRFEDVSRLLLMLRDPDWSNRWKSIATTIGMAADKDGALGLIEYIKSVTVLPPYRQSA